MNADEFSIRQEIRQVIRETDLAAPHDIAAKVAENVPAKLLRVALAQALPEVVRNELGIHRSHLYNESAEVSPNAAAGDLAPRSSRSAKVVAIRQASAGWRAALSERVHVGNGEWLLLAECSADHLRYAAEERRVIASRTLASAERYEQLGAACEKHKVDRAADLPDAVLAALLGAEEAA
jgi:hypothetical protein